MDEKIGRVLRTLDELSLRDNTIVILQSDHGHSTEERAFGGGGNAGPYRGAKFSLFEGGIRVPAMIRYPARIPRGVSREQAAISWDWFPTIAEYVGASLPASLELDGRSLVPLLEQQDAPEPHDVLHWQVGSTSDKHAQWCARKGDWKLIGNPVDPLEPRSLSRRDRLFLSNLKLDRGESSNLASKHPAKIRELLRLHKAYVAKVKREQHERR